MEILLLSALAMCEPGESGVEIDLDTLTPVEKKMLLVLLYEHLGTVEDEEDIDETEFADEDEADVPEPQIFHAA